MTRAEFDAKLSPYFTLAQIDTLDAEALESALDAHGDAYDPDTLHAMGREHIAYLLACIADDEDAIAELAGSPMAPEQYKAFIHQLDIEW